jgi:hypothetical protein
MNRATGKTLVSVLTALPAILDRAIHLTLPSAIAIGGVEAQAIYRGLALLSAFLWRLSARCAESGAGGLA